MTGRMRKRFLAAAVCLALALPGCSARAGAAMLNLDPGVRPTMLNALPGKPLEQLVRQTAAGTVGDIALAIPGAFAVTRPSKALKTTYDKYFIMGTSNPSEPVYFEDKEIGRLGSSGTFGVQVPLNLGENTFRFSQGGKTATVTITRTSPPAAAPISVITQSSMVPAMFAGAKIGEVLELGCTAPSGAKVTARFNGQAVPLTQAVAAAPGIPAKFIGGLEIMGEYAADETVNAGKIDYTLEYNGAVTQYKSTGDVYVAGQGTRIAIRVESYLGFVYPDTKDLSVFREKLKRGAVDTIKSQNNTYFELSSGGWINKEQTSVLTGKSRAECKLSKVTTAANNREESYIFTGDNTPAYLTEIRDGSFFITFFNTGGSPRANMAASRLFSALSVSEDGGAVTCEFALKDPALLWGCNVSYEESDTVLTFRYRPKLKSGDRPLEGLTVLLDPGHGGSDPGALGMAGETGPAEREVNLAHAYAARDALAAMGANVLLTRGPEETVSLDERLEAVEQTRADMFIALHHNSLGENADGNKVSGVEVYYHTNFSKELANAMMRGLTGSPGLNREERFVDQGYYRVTLSAYAPSVLAELGYMCNPLEYERAADKAEIQKIGAAVAETVKNLLASQTV